MEAFVYIYSCELTEAINSSRTNVASQCFKKACIWMLDEPRNKDPKKPRPLPTPEIMKKIVLRQLDSKPPPDDPVQDVTQYNEEVLLWYLSDLLPWSTTS